MIIYDFCGFDVFRCFRDVRAFDGCVRFPLVLARRSHSVDIVDSDSNMWGGVGLWMMIIGFVSTFFCLFGGNFQPRWEVFSTHETGLPLIHTKDIGTPSGRPDSSSCDRGIPGMVQIL